MLSWAKEFFAEPYSLRSTEISNRAVVDGLSMICVAYNGKNAYGAYVGVYRQPFKLQGDALVTGQRSRRVHTGTCCAPDITWRPFPELSKLQ